MTVSQQRERIIIGLAKVEQKVNDLCVLVTKQNGHIEYNAREIIRNGKHISRIIGLGVGISFALGLGIAFL